MVSEGLHFTSRHNRALWLLVVCVIVSIHCTQCTIVCWRLFSSRRSLPFKKSCLHVKFAQYPGYNMIICSSQSSVLEIQPYNYDVGGSRNWQNSLVSFSSQACSIKFTPSWPLSVHHAIFLLFELSRNARFKVI